MNDYCLNTFPFTFPTPNKKRQRIIEYLVPEENFWP